MYKQVKNFEDLACWQEARKLRGKFYQLASTSPDYEKYRLASQIRGAAISVSSNIAEGFGRYNYQEKIQFARISRGSVFELEDHLYSCLDESYINKDHFDQLYSDCVNTAKSINGYISYIFDQKK